MDAYLVLDTDAASHVQRGSVPSEDRALLVNRTLCVTFVTVGEFYKGAHRRGWGQRKLAALEEWLRNVVVLPYDAAVARVWGRICAQRETEGRSLPANDAWIAACCISRDLPLLTYNRRDFAGIHGLRLVPESSSS